LGKKPKIENLKPFKPGQSGNPGGRAKLPEDIKEARKLNQIELERVINKYLYLDHADFEAEIKRPGVPMLELMLASIVKAAAQKGDQLRLDFILNRVIGKVKERIEVEAQKPFAVFRHKEDEPAIELGVDKRGQDEGCA
jgi:hypothetical protein